MNNGQQLATGGDKKKRRELDFYPTPPEVTAALLDFLRIPSSKIWEPACGDGAMSRVLEQYGNQVISTDIRETGYGVGGVDFLKTRKDDQGIHAIITNPPFAMSEEFIRHALSHNVEVVAMVLKSQYWHAAKRHKLFEEFPPAYVLAMTWRPDFMGGERGGSPTMECHWTVWIKGCTDTRYRLLTKPVSTQSQGDLLCASFQAGKAKGKKE